MTGRQVQTEALTAHASGSKQAAGNRFAKRFGVDGEGSDALTTNLAELGVEQGVKYGYHESQDSSSEEERREATDRGFTVE